MFKINPFHGAGIPQLNKQDQSFQYRTNIANAISPYKATRKMKTLANLEVDGYII